MKHFFTVILALFGTYSLQAAGLQIELQTAGSLASQIAAEQRADLKELVLSGVADVRDFRFMCDQLPVLSDLDMSGLQIVAYEPEGSIAGQVPAFAFCDENTRTGKGSLSSVILPIQLKTIGESAFEGCKNLRQLDFSANVELEEIGVSAFSYCMRLLRFKLPASLKLIGKGAFANCSQLKELDFSEAVSLVKIDDWAFNYCIRLTELDLTATTSLVAVGENAFTACVGLVTVVFPSSLEEVGLNAFMGCNKLAQADFSRCGHMEFLGGSAFYNCISLHSIQLPPALKSIGGSALHGCKSLDKIVFPATLSAVGDWTFAGCVGLKNIHCEAIQPPVVGLGAFDESGKSGCALYVPDVECEVYRQNLDWSGFEIQPLSLSGLERLNASELNIHVKDGILVVQSTEPMHQIEVFDLMGKRLVLLPVNATDCSVSLSKSASIVLCRVTFSAGGVQVTRVAL